MENHYSLSKPSEALQVATTLQTFVMDRKLTANIQGKNYPLVEAWQFAGSQLGLIPIVENVSCLSNEKEIKYSAEVKVIRLSDGITLSKGFAVCSNLEHSKKRFDEYAIASMAQTRAVGKAYRNILAWLMKAAGFEATPAEEMDFNTGFSNLEIMEVPTETEKQLLRNLVFNSTLDEGGKELALSSIEACIDFKRYKQLHDRLEALQIPIDQINNPTQKDISKHLKKSVK